MHQVRATQVSSLQTHSLPICLSDVTHALVECKQLFLALRRQHSFLHDSAAHAWSLCVPACLSICVCCLLVHPSVCVSACLPVFMSAWLLAVQLSICLFARMPFHLPASLVDRNFLASLPVCPFDMESVCLSVSYTLSQTKYCQYCAQKCLCVYVVRRP